MIYKDKKVLLIAGGGTLGTYVSKELLKSGCFVDVICLEDKVSDNDHLRYFKTEATYEFLEKLLTENNYDGIVNFLHYANIEKYKPVHNLLIENTKHLIFLSSYRVYGDLEHPIKESSPRLLDITEDKEFLSVEDYALPKARGENFLHNECKNQPWTIVRPVISFSDKRFDLFMYSRNQVIEYARSGKTLILPEFAKKLTAGLDWSGNTGKLIANLMFKPEAIGQCYTISSAQNLTWGEVADIYTDLLGLKVEWTDEQTFKNALPCVETYDKWTYIYDRKFNRLIDNSKVLSATGLKKEDFYSIRKGIEKELEIYLSKEI